MAATRLTAPNGAVVSVAKEKVDGLLRRGFTEAKETKAPTKKSASGKKKSAKSDD